MIKFPYRASATAALILGSLTLHVFPSVTQTAEAAPQQNSASSPNTALQSTAPKEASQLDRLDGATSAQPNGASTVVNISEADTPPSPVSTVSTVATTANTSNNVGRAESSKTDSADCALPETYTATAYNLRGRTASGRFVTRGIIAADRRVLPLGSRVRLLAGVYSGEYTVADTGSAVRGRKIDVWVPGLREAVNFGRRKIKLTVLTYGAKKIARAAVVAAAAR